MEMLSVSQAAQKWKLSVRTVQNLCKAGKIPGAALFGRSWMIPADAQRPIDGRTVAGKAIKQQKVFYEPLIRKTPFLDMTDLYRVPGSADEVAESLAPHPEAQALFSAEITYSRGQIDKVYEYANLFLSSQSGFYAIISGSMLLGLCAMWKGDVQLWYKAKRHLYEASWRNETDRDILQLTLAAMDSAIRDTRDFPDWFARGCFDSLPRDSHPAARVYYIKYLLILAQDYALENADAKHSRPTGIISILPYTIEPMISQMVADKIVVAEIYLRLMCAIAYLQAGDDARGSIHLDKAIRLCLPDKLYGPLIEHRRQLGLFLDDRLALIDPEALKTVKVLHKQLLTGWTRLHNTVLERSVQVSLSMREREVARLAAFGLSNQAIAKQLHLSEYTVISLVNSAKNKTGVDNRADLGLYI